MRNYHSIAITAFVFCGLSILVSCRPKNTPVVSASAVTPTVSVKADIPIVLVSADIINSDGPASKDKFQQYYMVITLTNTQDTNIRFTVMTCSWSESFRFDTDSIYLYYPGCDSNFPTTIEILPHKTVKFFGILTCYKKNRNAINPPSFKIAFLDLPYNDWFLFPYSHEDKLKYKTYWSDSIKLERKLYSYEEEK